jgi:hypothetical protein
VDVEVVWPDGLRMLATGVTPRRIVTVSHPAAAEGPLGDDDDEVVFVAGRAFDIDTHEGIEGVVVTAGAFQSTTDQDGVFLLQVVPGEVDLLADGPGVDIVVPLDVTLTCALSAVLLPQLEPSALAEAYTDAFGVPPTGGRGTIFVRVLGQGDAPRVGATVDVDLEHLGIARMSEETTVGDVVSEDTFAILIGDVVTGDAVITVTTPDGGPCRGRTRFEVRPDVSTWVTYRCP